MLGLLWIKSTRFEKFDPTPQLLLQARGTTNQPNKPGGPMHKNRIYFSSTIIFCLLISVLTIQCSKDNSKAILEQQLTDIVGDSSNLLPTYLSSFKPNMTCADIKALYPNLPDCDPEKSTNRFKMPIKDQPILEKMELSTYKGKLDVVTLYFKKEIHESFKDASLKVIETKWGKVTPEDKRNDNTLSRVMRTKPGFFNITRRNMMDQWYLEFSFRRYKN